jgi:hypothetical protein
MLYTTAARLTSESCIKFANSTHRMPASWNQESCASHIPVVSWNPDRSTSHYPSQSWYQDRSESLPKIPAEAITDARLLLEFHEKQLDQRQRQATILEANRVSQSSSIDGTGTQSSRAFEEIFEADTGWTENGHEMLGSSSQQHHRFSQERYQVG